MEQTKQELKYGKPFPVSGKAFDEVYAYLGMLVHHYNFGKEQDIIFFDEAETSAARMNNKKRTIELSDLVDPEIVGSVKHIIRTEIRGDDVSTSRL